MDCTFIVYCNVNNAKSVKAERWRQTLFLKGRKYQKTYRRRALFRTLTTNANLLRSLPSKLFKEQEQRRSLEILQFDDQFL